MIRVADKKRNVTKWRWAFIKLFIWIVCFCSLVLLGADVAFADGADPQIAKWYQDKKAAISLRFDDAMESHVAFVIPTLNQHGLKGTFMVNPGRSVYQRHQSFWEQEVPGMGHHLGNHTLHHEGADSVQEADFEIGEVSRLIWQLYPDSSPLLAFASGGGEKWGGKDWEDADKAYKDLVQKYHLIDLYDGTHPSKAVRSSHTEEDLCQVIETALAAKAYQPFHFHHIGNHRIKDRIHAIRYGSSGTVPESLFLNFIECLLAERDNIWIAPIADIVKYQTEYEAATISDIQRHDTRLTFRLDVDLDAELYDHMLTLILPKYQQKTPLYVIQGDRRIDAITKTDASHLVDISPVSNKVTIVYD